MTARARYWVASTLAAWACRCAALSVWLSGRARRVARIDAPAVEARAVEAPATVPQTPTDLDCFVAIAVLNARISKGKARVQ